MLSLVEQVRNFEDGGESGCFQSYCSSYSMEHPVVTIDQIEIVPQWNNASFRFLTATFGYFIGSISNIKYWLHELPHNGASQAF